MCSRRLPNVLDFCVENEDFTPNAIRYLMKNQDSNGFKGCFPKVGSRRRVDTDKFFARIDELNREETS